MKLAVLTVPLVVVLACAGADQPARARIAPEYDKKTGKLQLLKYDSNGNGKVDTWSYMDGGRIVRIEIDTNEDGRIDRWEYYGADQKLEKVALATNGDGKATRTEWYAKDVLVRAEEDTDEDGRTDKWETYENGHLSSVAFDTLHRGVPDRRLVYDADGSVRVEVTP
jgi:antitoxin component YwqK of YwqJK toxin-antitoxin module